MSKKLKIKDPIDILDHDFISWIIRKEMECVIDTREPTGFFVTDREAEAAKVIRDYYSVGGGAPR